MLSLSCLSVTEPVDLAASLKRILKDCLAGVIAKDVKRCAEFLSLGPRIIILYIENHKNTLQYKRYLFKRKDIPPIW